MHVYYLWLDYMFVAAKSIWYVVNVMVRGYLVYQEVWEVRVGEILSLIREVDNCMRLLFLPLGFISTDISDKRYSIKYRNV